jgi:predicted dehydrogenase
LVSHYASKENVFVKVNKAQVGVVGLGLVSYAHIRGYLTHPLADVVAVCDLNEKQAQRVAREFDIRKYYTSYDEMLTDADINTVDIVTPTYLHKPMAVAAAKAGKHIHCEKPLALTLAEGEDICSEADKHGVALAVDETYIFMATTVMAHELIEAGEIGKPQQIRQRFGAWVDRPGVIHAIHGESGGSEQWRGDSRKAGGNGFPWQFDHNIHFFATAQYLMNGSPVKKVHSVKADNSWLRERAKVTSGRDAPDDLYDVNTADDFPLITWTYDDPACQGVWMRAERLNGKYDYMTGFSVSISGEKGLIEFLGEGGGGLQWNGGPVHLVLHRDGKEPSTFRFDDEGPDDIWQSEVSYYSAAHVHRMHEFVDSLTSGRPSRYTGRDGLRDLRVAIASICSAREGAPVEVREVTDSRFYSQGET